MCQIPVGSGERKGIRKAKAVCAPISTQGTHTAAECPELKARADTKAAVDKQVRSRAETLGSSPGTPSDWEWYNIMIITDDCL
eukprot:2065902-Rhodomonas_salina.1